MHKFKLTIKLDNKDYCNVCPCLKMIYAPIAKGHCVYHKADIKDEFTKDGHHPFYRPDICKESEVKNDNT